MYLEEFTDYKNQLVDDLLSNEEIVRLLDDKYELHKDDDPRRYFVGYRQDWGPNWHPQIFPYEYVPETIEYGRTFICFDVDISRMSSRREAPSNKMLYSPVLYIWIFTHKSLLWLPVGGVRTDRLVQEIAKSINGSHFYGAGSLELYSVQRFAPLMDYQGKVMTFDAKDWNHANPTGRQWPSNRRVGA